MFTENFRYLNSGGEASHILEETSRDDKIDVYYIETDAVDHFIILIDNVELEALMRLLSEYGASDIINRLDYYLRPSTFKGV